MASSPGPWKYCGASEGECHCGLVWEATGAFVVAHVVRDDDDHTKDDATFLANGRLIAAAPELLAYLKALRARLIRPRGRLFDCTVCGACWADDRPESHEMYARPGDLPCPVDEARALLSRIDPTPTRGGTP